MKTSSYIRLVISAGLLMLTQTGKAQGNYFHGTGAGASNTTGQNNAFAGFDAGRDNTTGSFNTSFGFSAGRFNKIASRNTAVGAFAGFYGTMNVVHANAGNNVYVGYQAGFRNSEGSGNTFVGTEAGVTNIAGNANTFIGSEAGRVNTYGGSNTFVGRWAGRANTIGGSNAFFGQSAGDKTTTGGFNTFIGRSAGNLNTTGSHNTALGNWAGPSNGNLTNATAIGYRAFVSLSNSLVLGSVSGTNGATATVNVGIGTTFPEYRLHVNGSAAKPGTSTWIVISDRRLKTEVEPYSEGLEQLMAVQPVWFRYNGKAGLPTEKRYVGVIAQEMQQIAPHTVGEFTYQDTTGRTEQYLDYDANALTYMLVNAVKELKTENEQLRQELVQIKRLLEGQPDSGSGAKLWQNEPNPASKSTIIRYFIPETASYAQLRVFSVIGQEVYYQELSGKGEGKVEISQQMLPAGTYIYNLVVDGKAVDSKKMILNR